MELTAKQYETAVNNAAEISQVLLDMESGKYVLALFSELVQELLDEGNISGATSVVRKLHEVAKISFEQSKLDGGNSATWISLFSAALDDSFEETVP